MDTNNLEKALNDAKSTEVPASSSTEHPAVSPEEEIGFHKGALNTLSAERNELVKMLGNVEGIMAAHISRLKELGVDLK